MEEASGPPQDSSSQYRNAVIACDVIKSEDIKGFCIMRKIMLPIPSPPSAPSNWCGSSKISQTPLGLRKKTSRIVTIDGKTEFIG